jgi:hypothetical protein
MLSAFSMTKIALLCSDLVASKYSPFYYLQNGTQASIKDLVDVLNGAEVPGKDVVGTFLSVEKN